MNQIFVTRFVPFFFVCLVVLARLCTKLAPLENWFSQFGVWITGPTCPKPWSQPHRTSLGWTGTPTVSRGLPTSVGNLANTLVAEWGQVCTARFQNASLPESYSKSRGCCGSRLMLMVLEWDMPQSHMVLIFLGCPNTFGHSVSKSPVCQGTSQQNAE